MKVGKVAATLCAIAACTSAAADHERLGDRAYDAGDYEAALGQYLAAARTRPKDRILAKLGSVALHTGDYREAADAYSRLAEDDPSRAEEAATGLERVARGAEQAGDMTALREAIATLRAIAPQRATGRYAFQLLRKEKLSSSEALGLLPYAIAAAPDAEAADSLLAVYGSAFQETTACEEAVHAFSAVLRRSQDTVLRIAAGDGLAICALELGREAQAATRAEAAERWYGEAVRVDSASAIGREALIRLGELRVSQGDIFGAALAYQTAIALSESQDSLRAVAVAKLNALGGASPSDSGRTGTQ